MQLFKWMASFSTLNGYLVDLLVRGNFFIYMILVKTPKYR